MLYALFKSSSERGTDRYSMKSEITIMKSEIIIAGMTWFIMYGDAGVTCYIVFMCI